jgi:hypothetical protein
VSTTTLTAVPPDVVRPIPWRRLGWVAWRRQRTTILATLTLLGLLAIYLIVTGLQMRSAWHTVQTCTPQRSTACNFEWANFKDTHANLGFFSALFIFAPILIGSFAGAPLIGRELETGTFRYACTQGVGRVRWVTALLVSGAVAVAGLAGIAGALIAWHDRPLWQAQIVTRLGPSEFPSTGVAIIGWSLAAYAVGVVAGLLWRRVLPALATALGIAVGLGIASSKLRLRYLPPLKTSGLAYVPNSETIQQWWQKSGAVVTDAHLNAALRAAGVQQVDVGGAGKSTPATPGVGPDPITYLLHHGYTQWTSYQPANRYWTFQGIEFGWLTAVAVLLLTATVLLVRRRDA